MLVDFVYEFHIPVDTCMHIYIYIYVCVWVCVYILMCVFVCSYTYSQGPVFKQNVTTVKGNSWSQMQAHHIVSSSSLFNL
jgi:hypothetical protein